MSDDSRSSAEETSTRHVVGGIDHGVSGYTHHRCRCEVCTEANRKWCLEYRRRPISEKRFQHGRSAYANHGCRCEVCRGAQRMYGRKYRERPLSEKTFTHGRGGYSNHGCRCEVCVQANRDHSRKYYLLRKARAGRS